MTEWTLSIGGDSNGDERFYHSVNDDRETDQMPLIVSKVSCLPTEENGRVSFLEFPRLLSALLKISPDVHLPSLSSLFSPCPDHPFHVCPRGCHALCVFVPLLTPPTLCCCFCFSCKHVHFSLPERSLTFAECLGPGVKMPRTRGTAKPRWTYGERE